MNKPIQVSFISDISIKITFKLLIKILIIFLGHFKYLYFPDHFKRTSPPLDENLEFLSELSNCGQFNKNYVGADANLQLWTQLLHIDCRQMLLLAKCMKMNITAVQNFK